MCSLFGVCLRLTGTAIVQSHKSLLQALKRQVLKTLSVFLSSSAETFSLPSPASSQEISVSAVVGPKSVRIKYDDILDLHDSLFQELAQHIPSFFSDCGSFAGNINKFPSTYMELKVTALTLRCCIRLLPLIELFDTGLRYTAGVAIDRLLQKLSSPTEPCLLPGAERTSAETPSEVQPNRALTLCVILEVRCKHTEFQSFREGVLRNLLIAAAVYTARDHEEHGPIFCE